MIVDATEAGNVTREINHFAAVETGSATRSALRTLQSGQMAQPNVVFMEVRGSWLAALNRFYIISFWRRQYVFSGLAIFVAVFPLLSSTLKMIRLTLCMFFIHTLRDECVRITKGTTIQIQV